MMMEQQVQVTRGTADFRAGGPGDSRCGTSSQPTAAAICGLLFDICRRHRNRFYIIFFVDIVIHR